MRIKPNRTILEGKVDAVERAADGWGAEVHVTVQNSRAADGSADFLQAKPGSVIKVFAAEPDALEAGKTYRLTTSVSGGPSGERVVLEKADPHEP